MGVLGFGVWGLEFLGFWKPLASSLRGLIRVSDGFHKDPIRESMRASLEASGFWGLGFWGFKALGFRVWGVRVLGFRVLGFRVLGFGV